MKKFLSALMAIVLAISTALAASAAFDSRTAENSTVEIPTLYFDSAEAYERHLNQLKSDVGRGYTQDKPEITKGFLSTTFYNTLTANFYVAYRQWLIELRGNQRSFVPFNLDTDKLSDALNDITPKNGFFRSSIDYKSILSSLNKGSQMAVKSNKYGTDKVAMKLLDLLDETLDKLITEKFNSII